MLMLMLMSKCEHMLMLVLVLVLMLMSKCEPALIFIYSIKFAVTLNISNLVFFSPIGLSGKRSWEPKYCESILFNFA